MTLPVQNPPANLSVRETSARMTPVPASRRFGEVLALGGRAVLEGALSAATLVPGGNLLTAAVRGATSNTPLSGSISLGSSTSSSAPVDGPLGSVLGGGSTSTGALGSGTSSSGGTGSTGSTGALGSQGDDMLARQQEMSVQMLQLQESVGDEDRRYTALSNVLKARFDMAKNAIGNIRG